MKKIRNFKNISLKNALLNKNNRKSKSLNCKDQSIIENKNTSNILTRNIQNDFNIKELKIKDIIKYNSLDSDFNIKSGNDMVEKIYKANKQKIKDNEIEDEEIDSLNEQIREIMLKNFEIQTNIENQLNMRLVYEKNQKSIANYINDLNQKFRNYDNTINEYESTIYKMQRDNRKLQNEYDKKIEAIENENEKLKKRIRDRIELYLHQKGQIDEKSAKTQNLENEIHIQEDTIKERLNMNKKKMNDLEDKYDQIYKKIIDIEVNCDDKKIKSLLENPLYTIEENNIKKKGNEKEQSGNKEVKDINQKIEDYEINNDALLFELKELNKQYEEMTKNKNKKNKKNRETSRDKKSTYSIGSTMKSSISNFIKDTQSEHKFK